MSNVYFMIIRHNGLKEDIVKHIFNTIDECKTVEIKHIYYIKWSEDEKESSLLSLYDHITDEKAIEDIMDVNDVIMAGFILCDHVPIPPLEKVASDNWNVVTIKRTVRCKYGNVIHLSDTSEHAYNEIKKLLGLSREEVDEIVKRDKVSTEETTTHSELAEVFNKIKDGKEVLWTPKK